MRKITLSAEEYTISDLPNVDQLVYDANGFPAASNFTKKSKGAILKHLNQTKTLTVRKNKLCWNNKTKSMKGGGAKKKRSKKQSRSRSRSRTNSKSDNLLKMMMMQQMLTRSYKKNQDQTEEHYLNQLGAGDVANSPTSSLSFKGTLRQYQDHLEKMNDLSWDQLDSSELEEIVEIQDHLKNTSLMLTKITEAFLANLKKDVLDQATSIKNQVKSNKYGNEYNNQLRGERTKIKQFLGKYSTLNHLCQINESSFDASAAFCKLYLDVEKLSKEIDQLSVQNDFNKNLTELNNFLSNKITLSPQEVTAKVDENNALINQHPDEYLGASLVYQFQRTHKQIIDKETERFREERLREDAERAKSKTSVTFAPTPDLNLIDPDPMNKEQSSPKYISVEKTTTTITKPTPEPVGFLAALFGPTQPTTSTTQPTTSTTQPIQQPQPTQPQLTTPQLTFEERLAKLEQHHHTQQKKPEDLYQLNPTAISPQQPNYY